MNGFGFCMVYLRKQRYYYWIANEILLLWVRSETFPSHPSGIQVLVFWYVGETTRLQLQNGFDAHDFVEELRGRTERRRSFCI